MSTSSSSPSDTRYQPRHHQPDSNQDWDLWDPETLDLYTKPPKPSAIRRLADAHARHAGHDGHGAADAHPKQDHTVRQTVLHTDHTDPPNRTSQAAAAPARILKMEASQEAEIPSRSLPVHNIRPAYAHPIQPMLDLRPALPEGIQAQKEVDPSAQGRMAAAGAIPLAPSIKAAQTSPAAADFQPAAERFAARQNAREDRRLRTGPLIGLQLLLVLALGALWFSDLHNAAIYSKVPFEQVLARLQEEVDPALYPTAETVTLKRAFSLDPEAFDSIVFLRSLDAMQAGELMLCASDDPEQLAAFETAAKARQQAQYGVYESYAPAQAALVKEAVVDVQGNYALYYVGEQPAEMAARFEAALQESGS